MTLNKYKFAFAVAIICFLSLYFQPSIIYGNSMEPTLRNGQLIICHKAELIAPNDLVLYTHKGRRDVKRVVGRPYDYLTIEEGVVLTNGYNVTKQFESSADNGTNIQLEDGEYYLLGDNRAASYDSRVYGPVHISAIQSRVFAVVHPVVPLLILIALTLYCVEGKRNSPLFWAIVRMFLLLGYPIWIGLNLLNGTPISCAFRQETGLMCPGCGLTTMTLALMRFDLSAAFKANPFFLITSPYIAYICYKFVRNEELEKMWSIIVFSCSLLVWWIVRNFII